MSRYFEFLRAATTNDFLKTVREEVAPNKEDEVVDSDSESDAIGGESEPDEDMKEVPQLPAKKREPKRQNSQAVVSLIHKYEPRLIDCSSDTNCLLTYTIDNVKLLDKTYGRDLEQFEYELTLLRKLLIEMYPMTGTQRNTFVDYTQIFKKYYVPLGETETKGAHIEIVRKVLRGQKSAVVEYLAKKEERLTERLRDKYLEDYNDVATKIRAMYQDGMNKTTTQAMVRLLLAISGACGNRKGELLDPNIKFWTYKKYLEKTIEMAY